MRTRARRGGGNRGIVRYCVLPDVHPPAGNVEPMMERGIIERIDARGRITVRLPDRVVVAEVNNGSGGCIGDRIEGDMRPGLRSWRNVGNGILSVVHVVAVLPVDEVFPPARDSDQNERRKLS
jgi:hypothetical protein